MAGAAGPGDVYSSFWAPLCAIGARDGQRANAQICVSVFGASIVPSQPRLLVGLSKTNYTHDLVERNGTLAITLLSREQIHLLEPLGLVSGRDRDKLADLDLRRTTDRDPFFPGGVAYFACEALRALDLGDSTVFLVAVRTAERLTDLPHMTWADARGRVGAAFLERWLEKSQQEQQIAERRMTWR